MHAAICAVFAMRVGVSKMQQMQLKVDGWLIELGRVGGSKTSYLSRIKRCAS